MTKLVKEGKSENDVVAAKPFADLDAKWAPTELASTNFIRVVYIRSPQRRHAPTVVKRNLPQELRADEDLVATAEKIAAHLIERRANHRPSRNPRPAA